MASLFKLGPVQILYLVLLAGLMGCGTDTVRSTYGRSYGPEAYNSPAGFSAFRALCDNAGFRTVTINRIVDRSSDLDVIVWTPDYFGSPGDEISEWLENWLAKDGKTLVFIARDYPAYADLLSQVVGAKQGIVFGNDDSTPAPIISKNSITDPVSEVAIKAAMDQIGLDAKRSLSGSVTLLPWGVVEQKEYRWKSATKLTGEWSDRLKGSEHRLVYRSVVRPFDLMSRVELGSLETDLQKSVDSHRQSTNNSSAGSTATGGTSPNSSSTQGSNSRAAANSSPVLKSSIVQYRDYFEPLLDSIKTKDFSYSVDVVLSDQQQGRNQKVPLISILTLDQRDRLALSQDEQERGEGDGDDYGDDYEEDYEEDYDAELDFDYLPSRSGEPSKIILVSTPSVCINYTMTKPGNIELSRALISEFKGKQVGFLTGESDPRMQLGMSSIPKQKGFDFFTQWPMSLITLHAAFAGAIVLFALFPILGRARSLPHDSRKNFSQHIVALGELLLKTRDQKYARHVISDYFRLVRRESHSPWVQNDSDKVGSVGRGTPDGGSPYRKQR